MQAKVSTGPSWAAYRVPASADPGFDRLVLVLLPAATAWAHDNGEGLVGETDDKIVTFFSLGVIVFFVLVVITGSAIQATSRGARRRRRRSTCAAASAGSGP